MARLHMARCAILPDLPGDGKVLSPYGCNHHNCTVVILQICCFAFLLNCNASSGVQNSPHSHWKAHCADRMALGTYSTLLSGGESVLCLQAVLPVGDTSSGCELRCWSQPMRSGGKSTGLSRCASILPVQSGVLVELSRAFPRAARVPGVRCLIP